MANHVVLKGRIANEIDFKKSSSGIELANFSVAVNRRFKKEGQPDADFFNCVSFGKTAQTIANYFSKGQEIYLEGSLQNNNWTDKEGVKRYSTNILVNFFEFCGNKKDNENTNTKNSPKAAYDEGYPPYEPEDYGDDLPF